MFWENNYIYLILDIRYISNCYLVFQLLVTKLLANLDLHWFIISDHVTQSDWLLLGKSIGGSGLRNAILGNVKEVEGIESIGAMH